MALVSTKENIDTSTPTGKLMLLNNFIYIFFYTDLCFRCQFLSNPTHLGVLERHIGISGNNDYKKGASSEYMHALSSLQMHAYISILNKNDIIIESVFKWFFEEYLKEVFELEGFKYIAPTRDASIYEKTLVLNAQIEAIIRQYAIYVEDGNIDRDYFEFMSQKTKISQTPSMIDKKYVYAQSNLIKNVTDWIYSDQSMLYYTNRTSEKYSNFEDLVTKENLTIDDFDSYNKPLLNKLVELGIVYVDENSFVKIDKDYAFILKDLYENQNLCYMHLNKRKKQIVDSLLSNKDLICCSSLFSKQEQQYIDYMLNVQQFYNGPGIRNKYAHGTNSLEENQQYKDYIELLKIMVLTIIKINDECCLKFKKN